MIMEINICADFCKETEELFRAYLKKMILICEIVTEKFAEIS